MAELVPSRSLRGLVPGGPVTGPLDVPGSKSIAQRALILAAVREGETTLGGFTYGEDVRGAFEVVRLLGGHVERPASGALIVSGRAPGRRAFPLGRDPLDAGESGTLARFVTALCALADLPGAQGVVQVRGSLRRRTSQPLFEALRQAGARLVAPREGHWPITITAAVPARRVTLVRPVSSQEVSALLVALAARGGDHDLHVAGPIPSRPYADMTLALLRAFGARIEEEQVVSLRREFHVHGPLRRGRFAFHIEPDVSAAAVGLAAGCLSGGRVVVSGVPLHSLQGDVRIVEHLTRFGCRAALDDDGLWAEGAPSRGAELDLSGEPDLAPVLAVVAAAAARRGAESLLSGLGTLPGKESQRLAVLSRGLNAAGFHVEAEADRLRVFPGHTPPAAVRPLDPAGDHRMAFAFALLGLLVPGGLPVSNPHCVSKSWPSFWEDLAAVGAAVRTD